MVVKMDDDPDFDLLPHLPKCVRFIEDGRRQGCVFVHCMAGKSRSVAVVVAYLMVAYNMTCEAAMHLVKRRHGVAAPNEGFVEQVRHVCAAGVGAGTDCCCMGAQLKKLENPRNKTRVACRKAYEVATGGATALELNAGRGECVCTGVCW